MIPSVKNYFYFFSPIKTLFYFYFVSLQTCTKNRVMKRLVLLGFLLLLLGFTQGQNTSIVMGEDNGIVTVSCPQTIQFYDPGGPDGNYANNSDYVQTFVSSDPNSCLQVSFVDFYTESGYSSSLRDYLCVFDGNQLIGRYSGNTSITPITATSGILTFIFHSDGSVNRRGWKATITCVSCSSQSSGNGAITLTCPQTIDFYDPGGANGNYPSNSNYIWTFVSSDPDMCLQVSFADFHTELNYDYLYIFDGNQLKDRYSGQTSIETIISTSGSLTFYFYADNYTNYSGWRAAVSCIECPSYPSGCVPQSTAVGSPCSTNGIHPFCTEDNDFNVAYPSVTGAFNASSFLGSGGYSCLVSTPRPSWFYMQIDNPGDLLIFIQQNSEVLSNGQPNSSSSQIDIDFVCWGPFEAASQEDFVSNLCCGFYSLDDISHGSHRPNNGNHQNDMGGYPDGSVVDCSYNNLGTEWCYIPNAQSGEWYLLLVCNYTASNSTNGRPGFFGFTSLPTAGGAQATTNCGLLAPIISNAPLCEGDTLILTCTNPQVGATYHWSGPNNWTATTTGHSVSIPNVQASESGAYTLQVSIPGAGFTIDPDTVMVTIRPAPTVTLASSADTVCNGTRVTLTAAGAGTAAQNYQWTPGNVTGRTRQVTPTTTTTYSVTGTTNGCSATATHTIVVHPKPVVSISPSSSVTICGGDSTLLSATGGAAGDSYTWLRGPETIAEGSAVWVKPPAGSSVTYQVTATNIYGCTSSKTRVVTARTLPQASISGRGQICRGTSTTLTASPATNCTYLWNTGATTRTITVTPERDTVYEVVVTDNNRCSKKATHAISLSWSDSLVYRDTICWNSTYEDANFVIAEPLAPGTQRYERVYTSGASCDSSVILYLTVRPKPRGEVERKTACNHYVWRGKDYTRSGVYLDSVSDRHRCLQVDTLRLTLNHSIASVDSVKTCESYTWINGQNYVSSTDTPTVTLGTALGCDSVVTLHLTIYHAVNEDFDKDTCSFYTWHGRTYRQTGVFIDSLRDEHGCRQVDTLRLTIHTPSPTKATAEACNSYTWLLNDSTYTESGTYTYGHADENRCWQVDTLVLTIHKAIDSAETRTVCESYQWYGRLYTQSGNYTHSKLDAHGCLQVDTLHLTVYHAQPVVERIKVCEPYTWRNKRYTVSGVYLDSLRDAHGCWQVDTLYLTVTSVPSLTLKSVKDATCNEDNGSVNIVSSGGTQPYRYVYLPSGTTAAFDHLSAGNYRLQLIDSIGCKAETRFSIRQVVHQLRLVRVENAHCGKADGVVEVSATGGYGVFTYQWKAPIVSNSNLAEHVSAGRYSVTVVDSNGCSQTLPFSVRDLAGANACFYFSTSNEKYVTFVNCTSPDVVDWHWSMGDGASSEEWQPTHVYDEPGNYRVVFTVKDEHQCEDSLALVYVIREIPTIYLPSAFVPESDIAENQVFKPIGNEISDENYEMLVYDRWGERVFISRNPQDGWDGCLKSGALAPQGVYAYQIRFQDMEGRPNSTHGTVLLLRGTEK